MAEPNATDIQKLAREYIEAEQFPLFRKQVEELLAQIEQNREQNPEPNPQAQSAQTELYERFYKSLDFGTGGLRGEIGGGRNRINCYTIRKATQGLASYICQNVPQEKRHVCLAYDSRNYSDLFAKEAALILCANGIRSTLFTSLRPTPELSFAVRQLGCCAGIVVTASHNPAKYNGYKVYWDDGAQVVSPHDTGIIAEVEAVSGELPAISEQAATDKGLLHWIDKEIDEPYIEMLAAQSLRPALFAQPSIKLVYTPLHGAGRRSVEMALKRLGIEVFTVPEQAEPDGNFPTTPFPNPEIAPAMKLALGHAKQRGADLVLGTDPDADRLGIAVPDTKGTTGTKGTNGAKSAKNEYLLISGNQLGAMLCDYLFRTRKELQSLPPNAAFVNTIVTSNLQNRIARSYGAADFKVLTGFKYIAGLLREWEQSGDYHYIFGCEESYGYLIGSAVRDKDAVSATLATVEMALWNAQQGHSLLDYLNDIYTRYGYYRETLIDHYFEGSQGSKTMNLMMESLRGESPAEIGGIQIESIKDYLGGTTTVIESGKVSRDIALPKSNVLQFYGAEGSIITARPSGTEPKIKFYASCVSNLADLPAAQRETEKKIAAVEQFMQQKIAAAAT